MAVSANCPSSCPTSSMTSWLMPRMAVLFIVGVGGCCCTLWRASESASSARLLALTEAKSMTFPPSSMRPFLAVSE